MSRQNIYHAVARCSPFFRFLPISGTLNSAGWVLYSYDMDGRRYVGPMTLNHAARMSPNILILNVM